MRSGMYACCSIFLGNRHFFGAYLKFGRVFKMFLDRAQFRRADQRFAIFFWEGRGNLNFKVDLFDHAAEITMHALNNADAGAVEAALAAETEYIDPGAGADRAQKHCKGGRGRTFAATTGWLV